LVIVSAHVIVSAMTMTQPRTARQTVYCGIEMRSRLEADYARHLDHLGWTWVYEPRCFAGPSGQYLPDFWVRIEHSRQDPRATTWQDLGYWEVKSSDLSVAEIDRSLTRMEIIWQSEPKANLTLVGWKYGGPSTFHWSASGEDRNWRRFIHNEWVYRCPPHYGQRRSERLLVRN
jgi:hypothetical protein